MKAEAVYYEPFVSNESEINKNNNEIEEVNAYDIENRNNNENNEENYKKISEGNA